MKRQCGDCQLCCKLVPVPSIDKSGGTACKWQKFHKGCTVYRKPQMPPECQLWTCRWLVNDDTADLPRPDRSHYVIDLMPDFITLRPDDGSEPTNVQVVQVWVDPNHREAHRDPALRRYMHRRAEQGIAAIVRFTPTDAFVIFPPPMAGDNEWHEIKTGMMRETSHTFDQIVSALGGQAKMVMTDE